MRVLSIATSIILAVLAAYATYAYLLLPIWQSALVFAIFALSFWSLISFVASFLDAIKATKAPFELADKISKVRAEMLSADKEYVQRVKEGKIVPKEPPRKPYPDLLRALAETNPSGFLLGQVPASNEFSPQLDDQTLERIAKANPSLVAGGKISQKKPQAAKKK
ncbi:MAG: hypothetical protein ABH829_02310 [archaeon]